jgi:hypothetical protein
VGLADRSKLRRLATAVAQSTFVEDDVFGPRRAQQADRREDSATKTQLDKQQGDHAGTVQPASEQAKDGLGLSADSASPSLFLSNLSLQLGANYFLDQTGESWL